MIGFECSGSTSGILNTSRQPRVSFFYCCPSAEQDVADRLDTPGGCNQRVIEFRLRSNRTFIFCKFVLGAVVNEAPYVMLGGGATREISWRRGCRKESQPIRPPTSTVAVLGHGRIYLAHPRIHQQHAQLHVTFVLFPLANALSLRSLSLSLPAMRKIIPKREGQ